MKQRFRRLSAGLVLAATLAFGAAAAHAQIPPQVYWSCTRYLFGIDTGSFIIINEGEYPGGGDWFVYWDCVYLATCYPTQDLNGNVEWFCN